MSLVVAPDPDWYFDNVLRYAEPDRARVWGPGPAAAWQQWWAEQARHALVALAADQGFVLSSAQLRSVGVSRQRARTLVRRGAWQAPSRGTVAPVDLRDPDRHLLQRRQHAVATAAAALRHADHVVSGRSAAILHGLPVFHLPETPDLTDAEPAGLGRRSRAHIYGATLTYDDVGRWFGVPVTTVPRTLVDLARHDRRDGIMAVDAALAERLVDRRQLGRALEQARGWPGVRQARHVVANADDRAESPLESLSRLVLVESGFPMPDLQVRIGDYRVDMLLRDRRLVIEVDGLAKYSDAEIRREKRREMRLRAMGYRVERVTWDDIVRFWPETQSRLLTAYRLPA